MELRNKNLTKLIPLFFIGILPEALRTKCARCSHYQKESALKVITKLYYDYPRQYNQLRMKWDPTGEYHRRFEEYLRGLQFNTIDSPSGNGVESGRCLISSRFLAENKSFYLVHQQCKSANNSPWSLQPAECQSLIQHLRTVFHRYF